MNVGRRRRVAAAARRQRHDDQILENSARIARLESANFADVDVEPDTDIDFAVVAERRDRIARARVDRRQHALIEVEQSPVGAVLALPVIHPARADLALVLVPPELLARLGIESDDRTLLREHVHDVADDQRIELIGLAGLVGPCNPELRDVALVDLVERGVLR